MDFPSQIIEPIEAELSEFTELFNTALSHEEGLLSQALQHIRQRGGKRMRPILILLLAKSFGQITKVTQHAAVGLELLHTASLVHDDVVDESDERRGQASVNANYDNKVAVLVGDYILSTALLSVSYTHSDRIVRDMAQLGRTLSDGEILQLTNISRKDISEEDYLQVIMRKTAALFETCAGIGALSAGASEEDVQQARKFGQNIGMIFQIRDDIFDYYDSNEIGKPTGNDMAEGKLTLPVIYALTHEHDDAMNQLAKKVKQGTITSEEIAILVQFAKEKGGITYAEQRMRDFHHDAQRFIDTRIQDATMRQSLQAYLDYVIQRSL